MARLKTVVDECLTVANASIDISSSTYNELGAVNWEDNDKSLPLFLFDKRSVEIAVDKFTRTNLPSRSTYTQTVYFFDTYLESEKSSTDLQTKQDALMVIADQYFAELRGRNATGNNGFYVGDINLVKPLDETHNERLIQLSYEVELQVMREDCTLGTFNYAGVEQPTALSCTSNTDTTITIGWTDNATAETAYEVWRSSDGNSFSLLDTIAADSTSYTDSSLPNETAYAYKVRAIDASNNGKFSNQVLCCTDTAGVSCDDATVENSDQSYQTTVSSGATLVLPDISFTDSDGSVSLVAAVIDVSATQCTPQTGIAYRRPVESGQITSYAIYDDGWQLSNGTYNYSPPSYPSTVARLDYTDTTPFLTLDANNAFGNTNRFTDDAGGQTYTNAYTIDHLTGLGWKTTLETGAQWANALNSANSATDFSYSDWRVPSITELFSILYYEITTGKNSLLLLDYAPFNNSANANYWSSTTSVLNSANASNIDTDSRHNQTGKTGALAYYLVRNHYT